MKKRSKGRKFNRESAQRKSFMKSLAREFFLKERIKTTDARAKELAVFSAKQITCAKRGDILCRRQLSKFFSSDITKKLISELAPRYKDRQGGYTRIMKLGPRNSDGSKMAIIELLK
jgi:large subunit ribosomal protein L17